MCDEEPSNFCCSGCFEVLGEAAASAKPGKGTFHDPSAWQQLEALDPARPFHDLNRPGSATRGGSFELIAAVNAIGHDMTQFWEPAS